MDENHLLKYVGNNNIKPYPGSFAYQYIGETFYSTIQNTVNKDLFRLFHLISHGSLFSSSTTHPAVSGKTPDQVDNRGLRLTFLHNNTSNFSLREHLIPFNEIEKFIQPEKYKLFYRKATGF